MSENSDSIFYRMSPKSRRFLIFSVWLVIWGGLIAGLFDARAYEYTVYAQCVHAVLFLALCRFSIIAFPVQVRIGFAIALAVGLYVPYMIWLLWMGTIGLSANLFVGYCPLARMLHLLPWNRDEPLSIGYLGRVFFTPPVSGRFRPPPAKGAAPVEAA